MELNDFIKLVKKAKHYTKQTALYKTKCLVNKERTRYTIYSLNTCRHCKSKNWQGIQVFFKRPMHLTVFQAGLLFALFYFKRVPSDYASYHKCIAGKEFIENIDTVLEVK